MLKFLIFFSVFILLVVGAFYFVFHSQFLKVTAVEISGSDRADEIKDILINTLSKSSRIKSLLGPENLLFWPPKISEIPSSLFWLSDLTIEKDWQETKITINVKEREPWLLWCLLGGQGLSNGQADASSTPISSSTGQAVPTVNEASLPAGQASSTASNNCYWLDEQGIVFTPTSKAEGFIIPKVFEQGGRRQLPLGQPFYGNPQIVKNTLEIIKEIKNSSLLAVSGFSIENISLQELTAETAGPKLYFSLRFLPQKLDEILSSLSGRFNFQKLEYIDFRVENRIYYK